MAPDRAQAQQLTVDFITSLDGYASAVGWPGWWGLQSPEYLAWLDEHNDDAETLLMGAETYRLMSGFAAEGAEGAAMEQLARAQKVVFSSKLEGPLPWPNTRVIPTDAVEAVRALKRDGDSPLRTIGSILLCRSLLRAGVVDRFRVVVFPVITGETGRQCIYDGYPDVALELVESRSFEGGLQLLEYVPTLLEGPLAAPDAG